MDAVEAYFQLSQDLAKDDPLLSNKFSQTAAEMARQIFDRSVTKHSGFLAADAAMQVFLIRGFRNETTLLIRELQQMIRQLEATGPGGGTIKALNDCRYKLADLYYSDERYSQALQLLDDTFKNRLSYSFEALQKLSYMIRRSNCLWRLGRPGPAASQLREAYDLSTKMPNLVEYKLDLVRCCAEQQQYVLCNSACNLLEIAAKNSYDASRDHVLASYQIRADCLEAMNRPTEAFQLLQAKIDNWTNLSDQLHAWTEMCRLNARHHMHNEVALIAWIQHKIDELSSPPDNESFQRILGAVITFSTYTLQYGDLLATKRILQCADTFLKRWDRADLDLTTLQFARSIVNQCIRTGNYATAEAVMNDLIKRVEARPGDNYELLNSLYQQIIAVTGEAGENSKSLELIDRFAARPVDEKKYGSDLASRRFARSIILRNLRRFDEAAAEATKGIELFERRKNHTGVTEGMILLGTIEFKRNRLKNADSILSEAAARSALDPGGPRQRALIWLAKTYTEERKLALADSRTEQLVKLSRQGDVARHLSGLLAASDLFELQGNKTRASTIRKEYNDYRESLAPPK